MSNLQLQELLPLLAQSKALLMGDLPQIRQAFEQMLTQAPVAAGVVFEPETVDGMPASWCVPSGASRHNVLLYLHGGGYVIGSSKAYRPLGSELASRLKARVLIPDYRLAPESPFPAAVQDALAAYRWLLERDYNPASIAIAGDSCGGGLTVATLAGIRDAGLPLPAGAAVISPWVDLEVKSESCVSKAKEDPLIEADGLRAMGATYLAGASPLESSASPVNANLAGLPPLLVQVGSAEILLDDATRLAARAGAQGVRVRLDIWPKMFHVWHTHSSHLDEARDALDDMSEFLLSHWPQQSK